MNTWGYLTRCWYCAQRIDGGAYCAWPSGCRQKAAAAEKDSAEWTARWRERMKNGTGRERLLARIDVGEQLDFELFYGGWLSQWAPTPFTVDRLKYPTAEHYMMALKASAFNDVDRLEAIMGTGDPAIAKALGRLVTGFDSATWQRIRCDVVMAGNRAKFRQHEVAYQTLMGTGNKVIVEASPTDRIWGVGFDETDPRCRDPRVWRGENLLGFTLMRVRDELRAGLLAADFRL